MNNKIKIYLVIALLSACSFSPDLVGMKKPRDPKEQKQIGDFLEESIVTILLDATQKYKKLKKQSKPFSKKSVPQIRSLVKLPELLKKIIKLFEENILPKDQSIPEKIKTNLNKIINHKSLEKVNLTIVQEKLGPFLIFLMCRFENNVIKTEKETNGNKIHYKLKKGQRLTKEKFNIINLLEKIMDLCEVKKQLQEKSILRPIFIAYLNMYLKLACLIFNSDAFCKTREIFLLEKAMTSKELWPLFNRIFEDYEKIKKL